MKLARPQASGDVKTAVVLVHRSEQRAVRSSSFLMLSLNGGHRNMTLIGRLQFLRGCTSRCTARPAVEAHAGDGRVVVDDGCVVGVAHDGYVHVSYGPVVETLGEPNGCRAGSGAT